MRIQKSKRMKSGNPEESKYDSAVELETIFLAAATLAPPVAREADVFLFCHAIHLVTPLDRLIFLLRK